MAPSGARRSGQSTPWTWTYFSDQTPSQRAAKAPRTPEGMLAPRGHLRPGAPSDARAVTKWWFCKALLIRAPRRRLVPHFLAKPEGTLLSGMCNGFLTRRSAEVMMWRTAETAGATGRKRLKDLSCPSCWGYSLGTSPQLKRTMRPLL